MNDRDFRWYDNTGGWRRSFHIRLWTSRLNRWWFRWNLIEPWRHRRSRFGSDVLRVNACNWNTGTCYCPTGLTNALHVRAFGFGFDLWIYRDRGPMPCLCTLNVMTCLPDDYAEEIEEYGGIERVNKMLEQTQEWVNQAMPRLRECFHGR